jgi:hypothetical protein
MPREVSKKLREILGTEAAETMVDWMDQRERHYEELRQETRADIAEVRQETNALRQETRVEFAGVRLEIVQLREETRVEFAKIRQEIAAESAKVRQAISDVRGDLRAGFAVMDARFAQLEAKFGDWKAEVLKWAMGFWVGSLLAIVAALITLSRISK